VGRGGGGRSDVFEKANWTGKGLRGGGGGETKNVRKRANRGDVIGFRVLQGVRWGKDTWFGYFRAKMKGEGTKSWLREGTVSRCDGGRGSAE